MTTNRYFTLYFFDKSQRLNSFRLQSRARRIFGHAGGSLWDGEEYEVSQHDSRDFWGGAIACLYCQGEGYACG